jgi:hypothetical protein
MDKDNKIRGLEIENKSLKAKIRRLQDALMIHEPDEYYEVYETNKEMIKKRENCDPYDILVEELREMKDYIEELREREAYHNKELKAMYMNYKNKEQSLMEDIKRLERLEKTYIKKIESLERQNVPINFGNTMLL